MDKYDCTKDVTEHIERVQTWLEDFAYVLEGRAKKHDASKLQSPEKEMFDEFTPLLKVHSVDSPEYEAARVQMGAALEHHYRNNRHHPEHYLNGIDGMTLHDIVEMACDWMAACQAKNVACDMDYLAKRFNMSPQLVQIFRNTYKEIDGWNAEQGVPVTDFYDGK